MFGGVNLIMSGDFWQLNPTGDTAIMSNPGSADLGIAQVASSMFWDCQTTDWGLQKWPGSNTYVHELSENIRSGEDRWWSQVLDQARLGRLSDENYNWLHGFPSTCIRQAGLQFWYHHRHAAKSPCTCPSDSNTDVCEACMEEKQRRCRVVQCREEKGWPIDDFEHAILLTPFNKAVWTFANLQARNTGIREGQQVVWIKTKDIPPKSWREYFPDDDALAKEQAK